jgi:hyaluronan synthase
MDDTLRPADKRAARAVVASTATQSPHTEAGERVLSAGRQADVRYRGRDRTADEPSQPARVGIRGLSRGGGLAGPRRAPVLAAREDPRGALNESYYIPTVEHRRRAVALWASLAVLASSAGLLWHVYLAVVDPDQRSLQVLWALGFTWMGWQWVGSWLDKPYTPGRGREHVLPVLAVTVIIPVYNEDPLVVDRVLFALSRQTRLPGHVIVVDDGSTVDYAAVRQHWQQYGPALTWLRQENAGKKHAQAAAFGYDDQADIFVTIDSDTTLERRALEEGLKPFADPRVQSVAGFEVAANPGVNWLTKTASARSLSFQIAACGVQSFFGDILVNRGAFALYRAQLLREVAYAYTHETFFGVPILLGDDAALTLFARGRGRTVQQPSAFSFTMYPETLSHHFRQWIRWMRATLIRDFWRLRYLPIASYGYAFTCINSVAFLATSAYPILVAVEWPRSDHFAATGLLAMFAWATVTSLRLLCIRRSDQTLLEHVGTLAYYPAALLWQTLVLRPLRLYGIATWRKQGWITRGKVEVRARRAS